MDVEEFERLVNAVFNQVNDVLVASKIEVSIVAVAALRIYVSACLQKDVNPETFKERMDFLCGDYIKAYEKAKNKDIEI